MYLERHTVTVTTAADGSATAYTPVVNGRVLQIDYVKSTFSDGVDFTITADTAGTTIWTEANVNTSKTCCPRQATHSTAGVAALYAAAGTAVNDCVGLANDRVKIVIASGGAVTTGTFHVIIG